MTAPDAPQPHRLTHRPFAALKGGAGPDPSSSPTPASLPAPKATSSERVTIRRERKGRGGKTVTFAEGPGLPRSKLDELARDAARALGTGARIESGALVLQGDQADRLVAWLISRGFSNVSRGN